jgi:LPXTG-motif cell wall-anchored protein
VDPGGAPLCTSGPAGESALMQVPGPCDVTDEATATVTVVAPGTIVIVKRTTVATSASFEFTLDTQSFRLQQDGTGTSAGVVPGSYTVTESAMSGWRVTNIVCTDATGDSVVSIADRQATIAVAPGETVTCEFTNAPSGQLPATGNNDLRQMLSMAAMLAGLGALLVLFDRRRRAQILG